MKVNIYYGGRGIIEDPTIYVMNKITEILEELRVEVVRYNLYEQKSSINMLPKTLKGVDGVILATHLEWMGIGGLMQQFLDACWLYGDKDVISKLYMLPVIMASTYGERDVECALIKAWELLGGIPVEGLCAYVEEHVAFETNAAIATKIEKKAEAFYRSISQKAIALPNSSNEVKKKVLKHKTIKLTPQESEQLSEYVSNDNYVKKQKEDIEELALMFKGMLGEEKKEENEEDKYIKIFKQSFLCEMNISASYQITFTDSEKEMYMKVDGNNIDCRYEHVEDVDMIIKISAKVLDDIIAGKQTFQNSFMTGGLTAKGNFKILRVLDTLFDFKDFR